MSGCGRTPGEGCGCDCGGARMRARQAAVMDEVVAAMQVAPVEASEAAGCGGMPAAAEPEPGGTGLAAEMPQP